MPDLLPLPSTNATYTCRQPSGVVLWVVYVEADLDRVNCCICCTLPDSFILHITTDWCRLFSSYLYVVYVSITLRAMHTWNSLELASFLFIFLPQTHLCPTSSRYPPTNATYVSRTSRFDVNEQKMNTLRKAARVPLPSAGHLLITTPANISYVVYTKNTPIVLHSQHHIISHIALIWYINNSPLFFLILILIYRIAYHMIYQDSWYRYRPLLPVMQLWYNVLYNVLRSTRYPSGSRRNRMTHLHVTPRLRITANKGSTCYIPGRPKR